MKKGCPTCANRAKIAGMDGNGGDFWRCTATPQIPEFTGQYLGGGTQQLVNLASFAPGHPCHDYQNALDCALWTAREAA